MNVDYANTNVTPQMREAYNIVANYSRDVQSKLNKRANLNIKGLKAPLNQDRIDGIVNRLTSEEFEKIKWILKEPINVFCNSVVDDTVKINVEHHHKLGLHPVIRRTTNGKCCKWCSNLAGVYNYPDEVPKDVYRRHRSCNCNVEYDPRDGRRQNVHSKKWKDEKEKYQEIGLQNQLNFIDKLTGLKSFIPENAIVTNCKTIAKGKEIRVVDRLVELYDGEAVDWEKRVGKVESEKYIHDVHWYEKDNVQYEVKLKYRKRKWNEIS